MHTLAGHSGIVFAVAFSPDGTRIVSGSGDNLAKIWDVAAGVEVSSHACTCWSVELDWASRGEKAAVFVVDTF